MSVRRLFVIRRWIMWRLDGCCVIMVDIYIYYRESIFRLFAGACACDVKEALASACYLYILSSLLVLYLIFYSVLQEIHSHILWTSCRWCLAVVTASIIFNGYCSMEHCSTAHAGPSQFQSS